MKPALLVFYGLANTYTENLVFSFSDCSGKHKEKKNG